MTRPSTLVRRYAGPAVGFGALALALGWVGYRAFGAGFGFQGNVPTFLVVLLNGLSLGGLYFITAAGFTLIFGLMRVVNMAHGSLYLFGGYVAWSLTSHHGFRFWEAGLLAALAGGGLGLLMQQLLLRWNLGQDLRQALITIAVSIILADQMLVHFGGVAETITPPGWLAGSVSLHVYSLQYPAFRLFVIGAALAVGVVLWAWIKRTRFGMLIRASVDDGGMTAALGVNVQLVFAVAFFVGSALAALGGVFGGTMLSLAPGEDSKFLLSSLVVVIIGGLGSLGGAALGALLLGLVEQLSSIYLPSGYTNYSILLTFALLVVVLAVRPSGFFGRTSPRSAASADRAPLGVKRATRADERLVLRRLWAGLSYGAVAAVLVVAAICPLVFSTYFTSAVAVTVLWTGLAATSLAFLSGYAGMVSLAQTALFGVSGFVASKLAVGSGWNPWLAALAGIGVAVAVALLFGAIASGSEGIYFLMITLALAVITYYYFSQVPTFGAHEGINGVVPPKALGDPVLHPTGIYYAALVCCLAGYLGLRYLRRTPFGLTLQGVRDEPERMSALGYNVRLHRTIGFAAGGSIAALAGVLSAWHNTRISPGSIDITRTIDVLTVAVIGGLYRLEGAWIGAFVFVMLDTYARGISDRFETYIGIIFLAIVVVSPDGVMGVWRSIDMRVRGLVGGGEEPSAGLTPPADGMPTARV
jgi:ABC-type branched-subunit amino acid transport system permease subunit